MEGQNVASVPAARVAAGGPDGHGVSNRAAEQMRSAAETGDPAVMLGALSDIDSLMASEDRKSTEARYSTAWAVPAAYVAAAYGAMEPVVLPEATAKMLKLSSRTDKEMVLTASVMTCWVPPDALYPVNDRSNGWSKMVRAVYLQTVLCLSGHMGYAGEYPYDAFKSMGISLLVPGAMDELRKWADGEDSAFGGSYLDVPDKYAVLALESASALNEALSEVDTPVHELLREEMVQRLLPSIPACLLDIHRQLSDIQEAQSLAAAGVSHHARRARRLRKRMEDRRSVLDSRWRDILAVEEIARELPSLAAGTADPDALMERLSIIADDDSLPLHPSSATSSDPSALSESMILGFEATALRSAAARCRSDSLASALRAAGITGDLGLPSPSVLESSSGV